MGSGKARAGVIRLRDTEPGLGQRNEVYPVNPEGKQQCMCAVWRTGCQGPSRCKGTEKKGIFQVQYGKAGGTLNRRYYGLLTTE